MTSLALSTGVAAPSPEEAVTALDTTREMRRLSPLLPGAAELHDLVPFALAYVTRYHDDVPHLAAASGLLNAALGRAWGEANAGATIRLTAGMLSLVGRLSELGNAERILTMGIEACQHAGDQRHLAHFLSRLGGLRYVHGDFHEGWQLWHDGQRLAREAGLSQCLWAPLTTFACVSDLMSDYTETLALADAWAERDPVCATVAVFVRGFHARHMHEPARAETDFTCCLRFLADMPAPLTAAQQLFSMTVQAERARVHGEAALARARAEAAIALAHLYGDWHTELALLIDHGLYSWQQGQRDDTRATAIRLGDLLSQVDTPFGGGCLRILSESVADTPAHVFPAARPTPHVVTSQVEQLSPREREVLRLVADGLTNLAVAERLVVSAATVKKHLEHIYAKLGAHTRTAAVARARALSLIA